MPPPDSFPSERSDMQAAKRARLGGLGALGSAMAQAGAPGFVGRANGCCGWGDASASTAAGGGRVGSSSQAEGNGGAGGSGGVGMPPSNSVKDLLSSFGLGKFAAANAQAMAAGGGGGGRNGAAPGTGGMPNSNSMMQLLAALDSPTGRLTEGVAEAASGAEASSGLGGSLLSGSGLNSASVSSLRGMLRSFSSTGSLEGMSAANLGEGQLIDLQNFAALTRNTSLQNALGSMSNNSSFNFGSLGGAVAGGRPGGRLGRQRRRRYDGTADAMAHGWQRIGGGGLPGHRPDTDGWRRHERCRRRQLGRSARREWRAAGRRAAPRVTLDDLAGRDGPLVLGDLADGADAQLQRDQFAGQARPTRTLGNTNGEGEQDEPKPNLLGCCVTCVPASASRELGGSGASGVRRSSGGQDANCGACGLCSEHV